METGTLPVTRETQMKATIRRLLEWLSWKRQEISVGTQVEIDNTWGAFYEFIYQNFHKPSLIYQHKLVVQPQPTHGLGESYQYFERKEGSQLGDI